MVDPGRGTVQDRKSTIKHNRDMQSIEKGNWAWHRETQGKKQHNRSGQVSKFKRIGPELCIVEQFHAVFVVNQIKLHSNFSIFLIACETLT